MEESRVIEDCLEASKSNTPIFGAIRKEIPVFNPSDYLSQGYPHYCRRNNKKPERFWCLRTGSAYEQQGKGKCDSRIFECRSERGNYRFKYVPLTSQFRIMSIISYETVFGKQYLFFQFSSIVPLFRSFHIEHPSQQRIFVYLTVILLQCVL